MKTKLRILVFLTLFFCLTVVPVSLQAIDTEDVPVVTNGLPSTSYLAKEKASIASDVHSSALAASRRDINPRSGPTIWADPFMVGEREWSNAANMGAPVGDVSLPIILSILFLYMIYRGVTTSKRRNNF